MAALSRRLMHNLNELRRLQSDYFTRLGRVEVTTVQACGTELDALALYYKGYVGAHRVGPDPATCRELEQHFSQVAEAMEHLRHCLRNQPAGIQAIYQSYQAGHTPWSLDGAQRASDVNHLIAQLWREGRAAAWFLPPEPAEAATPEAEAPADDRLGELRVLAGLMRRLAGIYDGLAGPEPFGGDPQAPRFDERDALVSNLADLIRKKARPGLHAVGIATSIHAWATGDLNPSPARFQDAYQGWKARHRPEPRRRAGPA